MTEGDSPIEQLRSELKAWLKTNLSPNWRASMTGVDPASFLEFQRDWLRKLVRAGYAVPHWPKGWPGSGRPLIEQMIIFEEMARGDAPRLMLYLISLYHGATSILEWGTEAQKARHLPAILDGEVWCQGFSEPNAGSDLAALKTKAVRKDDCYIVNGQKIWTTMGQFADYCILLVRTDPSAQKHAGITFLLLDMKSPGVHVKPIKQVTGDEEFSEVFLDEVEVPVQNRLGEEGQGWVVAQSTLASERGLTVFELSERLRVSMWRLTHAVTGSNELSQVFDDTLRRQVTDVSCKVEALRALVRQFMDKRVEGKATIGEASVVKLYYAKVLREFTVLGLYIQGISGQTAAPFTLGGGQETGNWMFDYLSSYTWTIAGGSNEIQRNIVAEKILKMPRDAYRLPTP